MRLSVHNELVKGNNVIIHENQVQIFQRFRQEEALYGKILIIHSDDELRNTFSANC